MNYKFVSALDGNIVYNVLLDEKDKLIELHPHALASESIIGNIYIGRISNIAKGIQAAFVNIGMETDVFMQLESGHRYIYTKDKPSDMAPKPGDELLVQVIKDPYMDKAATVTGMISIPGRYAVLTYHKNFIGLSSKIRDIHEKERLKKIYEPAVTEDYGFIVRTNAEGVKEEDLIEERDYLISQFNQLMEIKNYRPCFSCVSSQPQPVIKLIRDLYQGDISRYIFNHKPTYEAAVDYFNNNYYGDLVKKFELYEDSYDLFSLYGLRSKIEKASAERVWLNSGANLVIQPTEALTVIDVNTSKSSGKKNSSDTIFHINLEAAKEIARQIRLRNLSGIIIVDFIGMQDESHEKQLMEALSKLLASDRIKTVLVDITPLGLVEITRKKTDKNLYEKLKELEVNL